MGKRNAKSENEVGPSKRKQPNSLVDLKLYNYANGIVLDNQQIPMPGRSDLRLILSMVENQLEGIFEDQILGLAGIRAEVFDVVEDLMETRDQQWHDYFSTGWIKDFERALDIERKSDRKGGRPPENPRLFKRMAEILLKDTDMSYPAAAKQAMAELGILTKSASQKGKPPRDPETYGANFKAWMNDHDRLHKNPDDLRVALMLLQLIIEKMDLK